MASKISGSVQNIVRVMVIACLFWGLLRAVGSLATPSPVFTGRVCVLSYNIQADSARRSETADVILSANADVVCLQEVGQASFQYLQRKLRHRYPEELYRDAIHGFGGLAFFSKYELRDVVYLPAENGGWFPAWIVEAETPAGVVQILQVHLRPRVADVGGILVGHFTVGSIHQQEMAAYFERLKVGVPTLILGDFNEENGAPAIRFLENHGLLSALPLFEHDSHTWQGRIYGIKIRSQIDHVFFSQHFDCTGARVIRGGGSDHLPVYAAFEQRDALLQDAIESR